MVIAFVIKSCNYPPWDNAGRDIKQISEKRTVAEQRFIVYYAMIIGALSI